MLTALLCVFAGLWIPGIILLVVCARRAPRGFEDATGFHAIAEPVRHNAVAPDIGATVRTD